MAIKFVPPFLKKLALADGPLVDNAKLQAEIAQMKAQFEREDREARGDLFAGPMSPERPAAPRSLPFQELDLPSEPITDRMQRPVQPAPDPVPLLDRPSPVPLAGSDIPSPGPPPPLPADRPPGQFRFDPEDVERGK